jgi:cellulose synthase/poly-beta-1,6-N-acetylglucosamine synthase-like glycosyltransferase
MGWLFLFSLAVLIYIYYGYFLLLKTLVGLKGCFSVSQSPPSEPPMGKLPSISIVITVLNEEALIGNRLNNLLSQGYPIECLEFVVVSDGSTDHTVEKARAFAAAHPEVRVKLVEFAENRGRAPAQNAGVFAASHEIVVSTDADNIFMPGCLQALVAPFADPKVGVVGGIVLYRDNPSQISQSIQLYRLMEHRVRHYEQCLGVMAKTDAPCTAFRRQLWETIEEFEDIDSVITLFAKKQGYITVQADEAYCLDSPNVTWKQEIRQRSRMTRKNLLAILNRWQPSDWLKFPGFTLALGSHKLLRYFSFIFLLMIAISGTWLLTVHHLLVPFGLMAVIFLVLQLFFRWHLPIILAWKLGCFLLANLGFAWGVIGWLRGNREGRWTPTRKL